MASSNKVVVIKRGAFGVSHEAMGEVFDNRKALTSWLPSNIDIVHPGTGDFLREAVDVSYNEGEPLRYNSNIVIAKWLSGTTADDGILVRMVLKQVDLAGVGWEIFAPTDKLTKDSLSDVFKVRPEVLERVRVVASLEPFCTASKVGLQVGDILLRHRNHRKDELFLVSEPKPHVVGLGKGNSDDPAMMFVARMVPNFRGATSAASLAGIRSVSSFDSEEASDDSSLEEEVVVATPRGPFRGLRARVKQSNQFLSPRLGSAWARHGWSSHSKAPPNHIFATEAKRAQFQIPHRDSKTGLPLKTLSVHKTHALMTKSRYPTSRPTTSRRLGGTDGSGSGSGTVAGAGGNKVSLEELSIVDENTDPEKTKATVTASPSSQRITELEAEVASLKKALASKTTVRSA